MGYKDEVGFLEPVSEPMAFGTAMHYLAEQDLLAGEPRLDLLTNMNEWVEQLLVEQYNWSLDKVPNPRDFFDELAGAYRLWRAVVRPQLRGQPLGIETEMQLRLGDGNQGSIWLLGTPDIVYPRRLYDFKTSAKAWSQDKADVSIQATLYMALARQAFDVEIKDFTFFNYVRRSRDWIKLDTSRSVKQIDAALLSAYHFGLKLEAGLFTAQPVPEASFQKKRGWYCSPKFCGAWNVCSFKYINDTKDERVLAIRSWI